MTILTMLSFGNTILEFMRSDIISIFFPISLTIYLNDQVQCSIFPDNAVVLVMVFFKF